MLHRTFRKCMVPMCKHNTNSHPNKLFLRFPRDEKRRVKWIKALSIPYVPHNARYSCCEDHFNLAEDVQNWEYYKVFGTKMLLKPDVVPHLNINCPPTIPGNVTQYTMEERVKKAEFLETFRSNAPPPYEGRTYKKRKKSTVSDEHYIVVNAEDVTSPSEFFLVNEQASEESLFLMVDNTNETAESFTEYIITTENAEPPLAGQLFLINDDMNQMIPPFSDSSCDIVDKIKTEPVLKEDTNEKISNLSVIKKEKTLDDDIDVKMRLKVDTNEPLILKQEIEDVTETTDLYIEDVKHFT